MASPAFALDFRPLSLGEVLDRTFTVYRKHFLLFLGIAAPPQLLLIALNFLLFSTPSARSVFSPAAQKSNPGAVAAMMPEMSAFWGWMFLLVVFGWFAYAVMLGATTFAVSEIYLGRKPTVRSAYAMIRPRALRVVDICISVLIRVFGFFFLTMFVFTLAAGLFAAFVPWMGVAAIFIGWAAALLLLFRFCLRYGVCVPSLLLENLRSRQAIKRSIELTKGRLGGMFLLVVLIIIVVFAIVLVISGPTQGAMMFMQQSDQPPLWLVDLNILLSGVGQTVAGPLLTIALVLYYYDLRIRKEAMDLEVMISALGSSSSPAAAPPAVA